MSYEHITCDIDGPLMIVTLNRPDKLNAYTGLMGAEIADAFERADGDDNVRAIIVTGAGRAFCAGADVSGGAKSFDTSGSHGAGVFASSGTRSGRFVEAIFNCRKPSIAAINGAGRRRRHHHDLADGRSHCGQGAKIGFIFARRGLVPEAGSAWFLPKLVGLPQALRWCLSGRTFDARRGAARAVWSAKWSSRRELLHSRQGNRARDDGGNLRRLDRADPADAVALCRRAGSVRTAGHRQADVGRARRPCRRARGRAGLYREALAVVSRQGVEDMPSQYPWWPQECANNQEQRKQQP